MAWAIGLDRRLARIVCIVGKVGNFGERIVLASPDVPYSDNRMAGASAGSPSIAIDAAWASLHEECEDIALAFVANGTVAHTANPPPILGPNVTDPPTASMRSRMPVNP